MQNNAKNSPSASPELDQANRELARLREALDNPEVVQLSKVFLDETVKLGNKSPTAFKILMVLVGKMTQVNSLIISNESLEKMTQLSNSTVKRAIKLLREEDWIDVKKTGTSNVYRINADIFWHETAQGKFSEILSHVVFSFDEQDEVTKQRPPGQFTRHIPFVVTNDYGDKGELRTVQAELGF